MPSTPGSLKSPAAEAFPRRTSKPDTKAPKPSSTPTRTHARTAKPLLPWRMCSGYAHGRPWVHLGMADEEMFEETDEPGVLKARVTSDPGKLLYPSRRDGAVAAAFVSVASRLLMQHPRPRRRYPIGQRGSARITSSTVAATSSAPSACSPPARCCSPAWHALLRLPRPGRALDTKFSESRMSRVNRRNVSQQVNPVLSS